MSSLSIIQGDLNELKALRTQCKRDGVKMILSNQIHLLEEKQKNMYVYEAKNWPQGYCPKSISVIPENTQTNNLNEDLPLEAYTPITKYSWDQSEKSVKIYIELVGVQEKPDCVHVRYGKDNVEMYVKNLDNKFYSFTVKLHDSISSNECSHKVKKDMIVITLKKGSDLAKWPRLSHKDSPLKKPSTGTEAGSKTNNFAEAAVSGMKDPMSGIQDLMKKMYEEGDDEMKRTIAKAWTEAQSKNMKMP